MLEKEKCDLRTRSPEGLAKSIVTSYGRRGKLSRNSKQPIKVKVDTTSLMQTKPRLGQEPVKGPVSRKSRELFWPEKPFVKLRPAYSVKLVFSYVVKETKIKKLRLIRRGKTTAAKMMTLQII